MPIMLHKVYAAILAERLREEVERKGLLPSNQIGFKKGKGTMDNIYVINYLANRKRGKVNECLTVMFMDLKATRWIGGS